MNTQASNSLTSLPPSVLDRFVQAQRQDYPIALAEIRGGRKRSHWMWYIFPQIQGLGFSNMSQTYGIRGAAEARAYLQHPILGPRLLEITAAVLALEGRSAHTIFGSPDDLKLRSCCTLFASVSPPGSVFEQVLTKYYNGERDPATVERLTNGIAPFATRSDDG